MLETDLYRLVKDAFADVPRPAHFTDPTHCPECADHDSVLCSKSVETLTIKDVGNPCWDPICFISPEGFLYYFPALVRLALTEKDSLSQFLFHVHYWDHFACFSQTQKEIVLQVLHHIFELYTGELAGNWNAEESLLDELTLWEKIVAL